MKNKEEHTEKENWAPLGGGVPFSGRI